MLERAFGIAANDDGWLAQGVRAAVRRETNWSDVTTSPPIARVPSDWTVTTVGSGGESSSPACATSGTATSMFRSISSNFVATMKKMISRNNTSIIDVRFSAGASSCWECLRGMIGRNVAQHSLRLS